MRRASARLQREQSSTVPRQMQSHHSGIFEVIGEPTVDMICSSRPCFHRACYGELLLRARRIQTAPMQSRNRYASVLCLCVPSPSLSSGGGIYPLRRMSLAIIRANDWPHASHLFVPRGLSPGSTVCSFPHHSQLTFRSFISPSHVRRSASFSDSVYRSRTDIASTQSYT